jgi:hypothetical protein
MLVNEPKYFYTIDRPYRWTNGPSIIQFDSERGRFIESLERAKELAEADRVDSQRDDAVVTTYGVYYEV